MTVDGVKVVAVNGVIHVIDSVICRSTTRASTDRVFSPPEAAFIGGRLRQRQTITFVTFIAAEAAGRIHMAIASTVRREHTEGQVAKSIEAQTAKLPSDTFLWAAVTAIGASATLQMMGKQSASVFVGQWAPTLLILGLYNKLVKQHGSDFTDTSTGA